MNWPAAIIASVVLAVCLAWLIAAARWNRPDPEVTPSDSDTVPPEPSDRREP